MWRGLGYAGVVHVVAVERVAGDGAAGDVVLQHAPMVTDVRRATGRARGEGDIKVVPTGGGVDVDLGNGSRTVAVQTRRPFPSVGREIVRAEPLESADPDPVMIRIIRDAVCGVTQQSAPRVLGREVDDQSSSVA